MASKLLGHIKLVLRHKKYVFIAMKDCGHPIQGMLHDLSKFSLAELIESVKYFQGDRSPIEAAKEEKGYSSAWFHHRGRNKHHSQYWVDISFGEIRPCKIPWKYLVEHICDTIGAGKAYMGNKWTNSVPIDYWNSKDSKSYYHNDTRSILEYVYLLIKEYGWEDTAELIKNGVIKDIYENVPYDEVRREIYRIKTFYV